MSRPMSKPITPMLDARGAHTHAVQLSVLSPAYLSTPTAPYTFPPGPRAPGSGRQPTSRVMKAVSCCWRSSSGGGVVGEEPGFVGLVGCVGCGRFVVVELELAAGGGEVDAGVAEPPTRALGG